jgi:fructokinase
MIRIGVDFGGTKIEAAALGSSEDFLARVRAPNPGSYDASLETVRSLVAEIEATLGETGTVGVGAPGSISPMSGVIRNSNTIWLNGRDFTADLSAALRRPIRVANDANCFVLSEVRDGAARNAKIAFGVILGTGCGGGLAIDRVLIEGANGIAGEWGHVAVPQSSADAEPPRCWCGQRGCNEIWISGTGLQNDYAAAEGAALKCEDIVRLMRTTDAGATAAFERYLDRLGRALACVCNIVDPDTVVFGGGMSNVAEIYTLLPDVIRRYIFADHWGANLVPARWGDSSGVRGAARLWDP